MKSVLKRSFAGLVSGAALSLLLAVPSVAQTSTKVGALSCDVSAGVGLILFQKQTIRCAFTPSSGSPVDFYTGRIDEFGVALGAVEQGHLIWAVLAPIEGVPRGALAGTYAGVGGEATAGVGLGANVLVGGTGRAFSLQPVSVEGQVGVNVAGGITTVTLVAQP